MATREIDTRDSIRVVTSNNFLKAAGLEKTSIKARKLLYVAMAQCRMDDEGFFTYRISVKEFAGLMGIDASNVYDEADKLTDELMHGFIKYIPEGRKRFKKFQLFKKCEYTGSEIVFEMSEDMTPTMLNLKKDFTQPLLQDFMHMRSNYSIEVWHLLQREMHSRKPGTKRMEFYVSLEELRRITGTDKQKTYDKLSNFKNRILDKALREIEECCGVQITYTNHKQGRNIIGFDFVATYLGIDLTDYEPPQKYIDRARRFNLQQEAKRRKLTPEEQAEYDTLCAHAEQIELDFD